MIFVIRGSRRLNFRFKALFPFLVQNQANQLLSNSDLLVRPSTQEKGKLEVSYEGIASEVPIVFVNPQS